MNNVLKTILCLLVINLTCAFGYAQETKTVSTTVEFVVNTNKIIPNRHFNYYINTVIPFIRENADNIESVLIVGSASPEGRYDLNLKLAESRSEKLYSFISDLIPMYKVMMVNDYDLFLQKTGLDENDYPSLRAAYVEVDIKKPVEVQIDTVYIEKTDTIKVETITNNYYYKEVDKLINDVHNLPVFALYNDITSDFLFRANLGAEVYFKKMSFFMEGSFSAWPLYGKTYNIDFWHVGFRDYFNYDYNKFFVEVYGNAGYFDTDLISEIGKVGILYGGGIGFGYVFDLCPHWKLYPIIRFGLFERIYYADYYWSETGNIYISFNNYTNGKINNEGDSGGSNGNANIVVASKTITKEFFNDAYKAYYIGPTYVGIVLKRDFCISKRNKK